MKYNIIQTIASLYVGADTQKKQEYLKKMKSLFTKNVQTIQNKKTN